MGAIRYHPHFINEEDEAFKVTRLQNSWVMSLARCHGNPHSTTLCCLLGIVTKYKGRWCGPGSAPGAGNGGAALLPG